MSEEDEGQTTTPKTGDSEYRESLLTGNECKLPQELVPE